MKKIPIEFSVLNWKQSLKPKNLLQFTLIPLRHAVKIEHGLYSKTDF